MDHAGTLWANRISVVAGKRCSTPICVTATVALDTGTATVALEQNGKEIAIDAGDLAWMFQSWTCYCCGSRERKLSISAASPEESREAFYSKYSNLRAVESGEDVRQKARLEAAMTNGDVLCICMRCGSRDEQHMFNQVCDALIMSADLVTYTESSSNTRRRRCSSAKQAVPESSEVVDEAQANQHMEELLAELEIEGACKAAKVRRKNKQKRCNRKPCNCPEGQRGVEQQCQAVGEEAETMKNHLGRESDEDARLAVKIEEKQTLEDAPVEDKDADLAAEIVQKQTGGDDPVEDNDADLAAEIAQKQTGGDDPVEDKDAHLAAEIAQKQTGDDDPVEDKDANLAAEIAQKKIGDDDPVEDQDANLAAEIAQKQTGDDDPVEEPHSEEAQHARVSEALLWHDDDVRPAECKAPPKQTKNDAVEKPRSEVAQHATNSEAFLQHDDTQSRLQELGSDSTSLDCSTIREVGHGQDVVQPVSDIPVDLQDELVSLEESPDAFDLPDADTAQSVSDEQSPIGTFGLTNDDFAYALQLGNCHQFPWWAWSIGVTQTADDIQRNALHQPVQAAHRWWQATDIDVGSEILESWQIHPPMECNLTCSDSTSIGSEILESWQIHPPREGNVSCSDSTFELNTEPLKISLAGTAVVSAVSRDSCEPVRILPGSFKADPLKVMLSSSPKCIGPLHDDASSYSSEYTRCCESGDCCSSKLDALSPTLDESFSASLFADVEQLDDDGLHTEIRRTLEHLRKLHMQADLVRSRGSSGASAQTASDIV